MYETDDFVETLILMALSEDENLNELALLAETAGAEVVGILTQKRDKPHPAHYLGKGKVDELRLLIQHTGASGVLCDDELSSSQLKNLIKMLDVKILDRSMIILDIFAERAISSEGKTQVELAQLKYRMSRLTGLGIQLSRQGGTSSGTEGIGARGPGEKKLEIDRRHIQNRINKLNSDLDTIKTSRAVLRKQRTQNKVPVIALVGYTNAGKSTLLNILTQSDVFVADRLFATLDTTTRKIKLRKNALITDTVGFINKLPHHLIQAFRATLEELQYADLLLHVVDASNPEYEEQITVVEATLKDLKCLDKPVLKVFNKSDLTGDDGNGLKISAKTGHNIELLKTRIETQLFAI
ncbi:MAG: GTPase HflX [Turicibacter sp.]|nr:GTPase HflX [Turicibacter sp.]